MSDWTSQDFPKDKTHRQIFASTHWSVVLSAGNPSSPQAMQALSKLCEQYWFPLFSYLRQRGHDHHQAQDLVQEFFRHLLEKSILGGVVRDRGKFRAFLLTALNHFVNDEWDRAKTQKRGGEHTFVSLSADGVEGRYVREMGDQMSAEKLYQRRWITTLLNHVLTRLEQECRASGNANDFTELRVYLLGETGVPAYAEMAAKLGMSQGAVRVAVHRLRCRYRELFHQEILQTVASPNDLTEEIRYLLSVFDG